MVDLGVFDELDGVCLVQLEHGNIMGQLASRPTSPTIAAAMPRTKLLPVLLVKTFSPAEVSNSLTIFVVVVLPFVPLTTTTP
jgi:hypothetical protein